MASIRILSRSSSILFSSSFILIFLVPSFLSDDDERFSRCSPSPCGNITIHYPFWVDAQSEYCGHPGYKLSCNDNTTEMEMLSKAYSIKDINYDDQILTIVDKDFMDEACPQPSTNTTIDSTLFGYSPGDLNLILYYNCTSPIPFHNSPFHPLPCLTKNNNYAFFTFQPFPPYYEAFRYCHIRNVSLLETAKPRLEINPEIFGEVLKEGFKVEWTTESAWCFGCMVTDGRCGFNTTNLQYICLCRDRPRIGNCNGPPVPIIQGGNGDKYITKRNIAIGISTGAGCFLLVGFLFLLIRTNTSGLSRRYWKKKPNNAGNAHDVEEFLEIYGSLALRRYTYSALKKITNSFKDNLGQGGYGSVFKGMLGDGRLVAVKVLNESKGNGEDFINEVSSIGRTYHVNIVSLLGFCSEGSKRALIYEFMPNGSLEKFIYTEKPRQSHPLGWEKLYQIAIGVARGLEYLHRGCNTRILHFDIKPHNILLDEDFCPKISDFGLAKLCPTQNSTISMLGARGTFGYIAPEVYCRNIGGVSNKSDVYSYGMMVLEMVGGRKNIDPLVENTSEVYFPHWIYKRLTSYSHLDPHGYLGLHGIVSKVEEETARKMILVGLWCIQTNPTDRPSMSRVVEMLEGSLDGLPTPPQPYLSSSS